MDSGSIADNKEVRRFEMLLQSLSYVQFEGKAKEWQIEPIVLGDINLIVGKNASGKTKTLNIISALSNLLSGDCKLIFKSGNYDVKYSKDNREIVYRLEYQDTRVVKEQLVVDGKTELDRGPGGKGQIFAAVEGKDIEFHAPEGELACVVRRDELQHPFFDDLYNWAKSLRHYQFGTKFGQEYFAVLSQVDKEPELNLKDASRPVSVFRKGKMKYGGRFVDAVKNDMSAIGYNLEEIKIGPPTSITLQGGLASSAVGILTKEEGLPVETDQNSMSQGMFRTLSLIIQLNYSQIASIPSCILIDDIGEGLDYERATSLISLLIKKVKGSEVQLIMSTNDRFVMNSVPLEYWAVIERFPGGAKICNHANSKEKFEEFELSGLSNFDFFASRFYEEGKGGE